MAATCNLEMDDYYHVQPVMDEGRFIITQRIKIVVDQRYYCSTTASATATASATQYTATAAGKSSEGSKLGTLRLGGLEKSVYSIACKGCTIDLLLYLLLCHIVVSYLSWLRQRE